MSEWGGRCLRCAICLLAPAFFTEVFFATLFFAGAFFALAFRPAILRPAVFLAAALFTATCLAVDFLAVFFSAGVAVVLFRLLVATFAKRERVDVLAAFFAVMVRRAALPVLRLATFFIGGFSPLVFFLVFAAWEVAAARVRELLPGDLLPEDCLAFLAAINHYSFHESTKHKA